MSEGKRRVDRESTTDVREGRSGDGESCRKSGTRKWREGEEGAKSSHIHLHLCKLETVTIAMQRASKGCRDC